MLVKYLSTDDDTTDGTDLATTLPQSEEQEGKQINETNGEETAESNSKTDSGIIVGNQSTVHTHASSGGFDPPELETKVGDTVERKMDPGVPHTITSGNPDDTTTMGKLFDSGFLAAGNTYSQTFDTVGTIEYHCSLHPGEIAIIIV